jgi:hypothetical protein
VTVIPWHKRRFHHRRCVRAEGSNIVRGFVEIAKVCDDGSESPFCEPAYIKIEDEEFKYVAACFVDSL